MNWDGFYSAHMTASEGQGFAMFVFANGTVVGSDPLGVCFDGEYSTDESGRLSGLVTVKVPAGGTVVQGAIAGPAGITYQVPLDLDASDLEKPFVRLETSLGAVNIRLKKLREIR